MNLLIDTHAVIWFITDNDKLPLKTKQIIENKGNNCFVSIATYWEIGIKSSLKRLDLTSDLETIFQIIEDTGFDTLPITTRQILKNANLEYHHQDPFDRIIIAQAMTEKLKIISKDSQFENYDIPIIWENRWQTANIEQREDNLKYSLHFSREFHSLTYQKILPQVPIKFSF